MNQWEVYGMLAVLLNAKYAHTGPIDYTMFVLADAMRQEAKQAGSKAWDEYMDGVTAMFYVIYGDGK